MSSRKSTDKIRLIHSGDHINVYKSNDNIVVYHNEVIRDRATEIITVKYAQQDYDIAQWGEENLLPQSRETILKDNNIVPELIATKRGIIIGQGLQCYKIEYVDGKKEHIPVETPPRIADFLETTGFDEYATIAAGELLKHGNLFTEFIRKDFSQKIHSFNAKYCKNIRAGKQNPSGKVEKYYWHGSWSEDVAETKDQKPQMIPRYDPTAKKIQLKSLMHLGDPLFFDGYYYYPAYWGGKEWIELSNVIPKFHKANISNGYTIRFHIRIPKDYFLDKVKLMTATSDDEKKKCMNDAVALEQDFIEKMNKFLSGADNAGRAVYTKYDLIVDTVQKAFPGIEIIPIKVDLKDDALLKLFEKSNDANISAQGIHPSLASIQVQGKMSAGAEIRNALLSYIAIKTPIYRKMILKPLNLVKKLNGWPKDIYFTFQDIEITTLDVNPGGAVQKVQGSEV